MNITTETIDGIQVVRLNGDLDTTSSPQAQEAIDTLLDSGASNLLVNLEHVGFVSSTGLRVLLSTAKRLRSVGGNLRISNLNETVNEVFEISGFIAILNVFADEQSALSSG